MTRRAAWIPAWVWGHRWSMLTGVLAFGYLYIGATSPVPSIRWTTIAGALLVLAAPGLANRSHPIALLILVSGAVLPVVTGWWSVVIPATGLLILACGTAAVRATATGSASQRAIPRQLARLLRIAPPAVDHPTGG